jgi:catalase-peroxidase
VRLPRMRAARILEEGNAMDQAVKCPVMHGSGAGSNRHWWPTALNIDVLHRNSPLSDPMGGDFDYAKEFRSLDLKALSRTCAR